MCQECDAVTKLPALKSRLQSFKFADFLKSILLLLRWLM